MKNTQQDANSAEQGKQDKSFPGYPHYPASEDIYSNEQESAIDPEDLTKLKESAEETGPLNEKNFTEDISGGDLDIPGSELDDADELNGSEDEENNYYSLGGDNHNELEEDKGD